MASKEATKSFLFLDALQLLPQIKKLLAYIKSMDIALDKTFIKCLNMYPNEVSYLLPIAKVKLLIIQKVKSNGYQLLYDGRHFTNIHQNWPLEPIAMIQTIKLKICCNIFTMSLNLHLL